LRLDTLGAADNYTIAYPTSGDLRSRLIGEGRALRRCNQYKVRTKILGLFEAPRQLTGLWPVSKTVECSELSISCDQVWHPEVAARRPQIMRTFA
jgi:hypothetical protein